MIPSRRSGQAACKLPRWDAASPLWSRLPTRDGEGRPLADFMMLAPGLNRRTAGEQQAVVLLVRGVLERFGTDVVYAEFNLDLNVLWVSLRARPGLLSEVVWLLRRRVPMLRLVAHAPDRVG